MSSSQRASNNNDSTYANPYLDYETNDTMNAPISSEQSFPDRNPTQDHGSFEQMYSYPEDLDENLPSEIVAELDARDRLQSNFHEEDESVFSDAVQDAFKKYQNEQDELYAQMEECWNYMAQENEQADTSKSSLEPIQESALNPDANEFKPIWLKPSMPASNDEALASSKASSQNDTAAAAEKPF